MTSESFGRYQIINIVNFSKKQLCDENVFTKCQKKSGSGSEVAVCLYVSIKNTFIMTSASAELIVSIKWKIA